MIHWETYNKETYNVVNKEKILTPRRRILVDEELPTGQAFRNYVKKLI